MNDPLTVFLSARLDEDERIAQGAVAHLADGGELGFSFNDLPDPVRAYTGAWTPARTLPAIAAMRRIAAEHSPRLSSGRFTECRCCHMINEGAREDDEKCAWFTWPCPTVRALVYIWHSHPGYRQDWKPDRLPRLGTGDSGSGRSDVAREGLYLGDIISIATGDAARLADQLARRIDQIIGWAKVGLIKDRNDPDDPDAEYYLMKRENVDPMRDDILCAIGDVLSGTDAYGRLLSGRREPLQ